MISLNVGSASPWIQPNRKRGEDGSESSASIIALCCLTRWLCGSSVLLRPQLNHWTQSFLLITDFPSDHEPSNRP